MNKLLNGVCLLLAMILVSGCESTGSKKRYNKRDVIKVVHYNHDSIEAKDTVQATQRYSDLVAQFQQGQSVDYVQLWQSYHGSEFINQLNVDIDEFIGVLDQVDQQQISCDSVDWLGIQAKLFFSIRVQSRAKNCYESLGLFEQADYFQRSLQYVLQGMFEISDGKTSGTAHPVLMAGDADDYVELSGYSIIDTYIDIGGNGLGVYYVYVIERPDGEQRNIYFNFSRLLHKWLEVEYPFGWLDGRMVNEIIFTLARQSDNYDIASGKVLATYDEPEEAAHYYMSAIERGSLQGYYQLALLCYGRDIQLLSKSECFDYALLAAQSGYAPAYLVLAHFYRIGFGVEADEQIFESLMEKATKYLPNGKAWLSMVMIFETYLDQALKLQFYQRAAQLGSLHAKVQLYSRELFTQARAIDKEQDADKLQTMKKELIAKFELFRSKFGEDLSGNAGSSFSAMNVLLAKKIGFSEEQVEWLLQLAEKTAMKGYSYANYALGEIYENGVIKPKDIAKSRQYYLRAAQNFHVRGMLLTGFYYEKSGTPGDTIRAFNWYRMCAAKGNKWCLFNGALMSLNGFEYGWEANKAFGIMKSLAERALKNAYFPLANAYENGNGTEANLLEAVKWYAKVAEGGDKVSQYHLCRLGLEGHIVEGVNDNPTQWCIKSALQQYKPAFELLEQDGNSFKIFEYKPDEDEVYEIKADDSTE